MAQLVFFDQNHQYQLDGETIPSVSEITRFISREIYGNIMQFNLDRAAERGTKVHKALEVLDKFGSVEIPEDISGYIQAYVKFRKEHTVEWKEIEWPVHHAEKGFAGTIDRYGTVDGVPGITDFKTSAQKHESEWNAKMNLYRMMAEQSYPVESLNILHLKPDGTYKLIPVPIDDALALACLTLHKALQKPKRKRKEKNTPDE